MSLSAPSVRSVIARAFLFRPVLDAVRFHCVAICGMRPGRNTAVYPLLSVSSMFRSCRRISSNGGGDR